MSDKRYLEDLAVGQRFQSASSYQMDADRIKAFAAEFDPQPFHMDETVDSLFKGLAASGWHTAAATMRLMADSGLNLSEGLIGAGGQISWPQPTRPGDVLRLEGLILEIKPSRSKPAQGMVQIQFTTLNQNDEVLQVLTAWLVAFRRQATP